MSRNSLRKLTACVNASLTLEEIILSKQADSSRIYSTEEVLSVLEKLLYKFDPKRAVRELVQKIYANADGSCTVYIGVHMPGAGDRT